MPINPNSQTWQTITAETTKQIEESRKRLERAGLDLPQTEFERGRIAALRYIASLAESRDTIPIDPPQYN